MASLPTINASQEEVEALMKLPDAYNILSLYIFKGGQRPAGLWSSAPASVIAKWVDDKNVEMEERLEHGNLPYMISQRAANMRTLHVRLEASVPGPIPASCVGDLQNLFGGVLSSPPGLVSGTVANLQAVSEIEAQAAAEDRLLAILPAGSKVLRSMIVTI